MKQIRKGVFETNSSSTHSLTFSLNGKNRDVFAITGGKIIFGKEKGDLILCKNSRIRNCKLDSDYTWQERADYFWACYVGYDKVNKFQDYFEFKKNIISEFAKYNVEVEFNEDPIYVSYYIEDNLTPALACNCESLIDFIFGDNAEIVKLIDYDEYEQEEIRKRRKSWSGNWENSEEYFNEVD